MFTFTWHTWNKNTVCCSQTAVIEYNSTRYISPQKYCNMPDWAGPPSPWCAAWPRWRTSGWTAWWRRCCCPLHTVLTTEYTCTVAVHQDTHGSSRGGPPADFAKQASCSHWDRLAEQLSASSFRPSSKLRGVRREVTGASYTLAVTRFSFVRPLFRPPFFYPLKDNFLWWVVGYLWEHFWPLISGGRKCHKLKAMPSMVL